jgi:glutathionylspermidine synthase
VIQDAIAFYNDLFNAELAAAMQAQLEAAMHQRYLNFGGRPLCTVLRPNFLTVEQYEYLQSRCKLILGAFETAYAALVADPTLRAELDLTAEEEALIHLDPGFRSPTPTARLDSFLSHDGTLHFVEYNAETPAGAGYQDVLGDTFLELPVMQHFMTRYDVRSHDIRGRVLDTLLDCYRAWGGTDIPRIAIVDWPDVPTMPEFRIFKDYFQAQGVSAVITEPGSLEYANGRLRAGDFDINIVYKRVLTSELLLDRGLKHPLVAAVRDRAAMMVNPVHCKLLHKKMTFAVLTDEKHAHLFTIRQREAIAEHIPWTRKVEERHTLYRGRQIDLIPFIIDNRDRFVLKPNDEYGGRGIVIGWETDADEWESSVASALTSTSVVQGNVKIHREEFPAYADGSLHIGQRLVDLDPYVFQGNAIHGCLCRLSASTLLNVTAGAGSVVPTFLIEARS